MSILTNAFKFCITTILISSFVFKAWSEDFDSLHPGSAENLIADTEYLSQMATLLLEDVEKRVVERPPLASLNEMKKKIRQAAYLVARTSSLSESFLKTSLIDYPDPIMNNRILRESVCRFTIFRNMNMILISNLINSY